MQFKFQQIEPPLKEVDTTILAIDEEEAGDDVTILTTDYNDNTVEYKTTVAILLQQFGKSNMEELQKHLPTPALFKVDEDNNITTFM